MVMLIQRLGMMLGMVAASVIWQAFEADPNVAQLETVLPQVWPPSRKSAPFCFFVFASFAFFVKRTLFSRKETAADSQVRQEKKRLIVRQMKQALKWDVNEVNEEATKEAEKEEKKEKKRAPSAQDLYEILFDVVEDRHATEFGIDPNSEPYRNTVALFKERIAEDLRDASRYTKLARKTLENDSTKVDLDADDLKFCAQFVDGTKITELIDLCQRKIKKHFGRKFVPSELLKEAKAIKRELEMNQRKGFRMLLPMVTPLLPLYAVGLSLMIFDSSLGALNWHGIAAILDGISSGTMTLPELKLQCLSTWVTLVFCVFSHLTAWALVHKVTSQFRMKVRSEVMTSIMRQDMMFFDIFPSGLLQERLNNDAETLSNKLFELPLRLVHCSFMLLSNAYMVYILKPELFHMIFLPMPIVSVAQYFMIKYMDKLEERQRKIAEHSAAGTMEVLKEIRTVREFAMELEESENFRANSSYRAGLEEFSKALQHVVFISPLVCLFIGSRVASTYLAGTYVAVNAISVGQAIQIGFIGDHMQHCIRELMMLAPDSVKILNPLGRVCDMLSKEPKIEPLPTDAPKLKPESFNGHIVFKNVDFTYPSEPQKQILYSLSFELKPGERVAFVGTTGCGKSSTIKLIERFYSPQAGSITLDGHNIAEYDLYHLRRHMSVVAQDNMLFSTTIRENIIYGLPRERREQIQDWEIEEACKKANAWGFVNEFPRKLETYAGERGVKLSGGQKQRLAIARALIRKPSIILLDEATSALDAKAEGVVQKALDSMIAANKTGCTIMIAHRLTTIKDCDNIIVMERGRIMEQGKHEELLAIPIKKADDGKTMLTGWYHDLWSTQMGSGDDGKVEDLKQRILMLKQENALLRACSAHVKLGQAVPGKLLTLQQLETSRNESNEVPDGPPCSNLEHAAIAA